MDWLGKPYHSLDYELKQKFGEKVAKLSLDGGFTCPNRDGTISTGGCIFCSNSGSGEFAASKTLSLSQQLLQSKQLLQKKWSSSKYIAYFQAFTNTYAPVSQLRNMYEEVLKDPEICGLAIATRPDCLPDDVLDLLEEINRSTYLWIELGLQTSNDATANIIHRGYPLSCYNDACQRLKNRNISFVTHMILGLPGKSYPDMEQTAKTIVASGAQGIKLHLLHVLKNTSLAKLYETGRFQTLSKDDYIDYVCRILQILPPEMVIHRLTGDGARSLLVAPQWSLDKRGILNQLHQLMREKNIVQGKKYV